MYERCDMGALVGTLHLYVTELLFHRLLYYPLMWKTWN